MQKQMTTCYPPGRWHAYLSEALQLGQIALPLIMASLVNMSISITDVVMMGWLGPVELAAGAIVSDYYSIFFYLSAGVLAAISPLIAQARGRNEWGSIRAITRQGMMLAALLALPGAALVYWSSHVLVSFGIDAGLVAIGEPYANVMALTYAVMLLVNVMHHFLSAHGKTRVIFIVTACAMPLNALGNYLFMFGAPGLEPMGLAGAGMSSLLTATFIFLALLGYALRSPASRRYHLLRSLPRQHRCYMGEIVRVGFPIGISNLGEMGVFLISTMTMGLFGAEVLAAHTVALRMGGVVFAIPMGFAQAAAVRIGLAFGKERFDELVTSMRMALAISGTAGIVTMMLLIVFATEIVHAFLGEEVAPAILTQAVTLLTILAIAEPFSNIGCVGAGALRGLQDTRVPMLYSLFAYWGAGFAGGWGLAFLSDAGGTGIWVGLSLATMLYAIAIARRVYTRFRVPSPSAMTSLAPAVA